MGFPLSTTLILANRQQRGCFYTWHVLWYLPDVPGSGCPNLRICPTCPSPFWIHLKLPNAPLAVIVQKFACPVLLRHEPDLLLVILSDLEQNAPPPARHGHRRSGDHGSGWLKTTSRNSVMPFMPFPSHSEPVSGGTPWGRP